MAHDEPSSTEKTESKPPKGVDHEANDPTEVSTRSITIPGTDSTSSKKAIKKVTLTGPTDHELSEDKTNTLNSADADTEAADFEDDGEAPSTQMSTGTGKKKKKRNRPKSKRGLNAPTGFEEYYVDAPLTPAEHEEEKQIYDPSYHFTQRIETAIQRFTAKRRLDSETKDLFDQYLIHGGVEAGPKMFGGGLDAETLKTKNAAEIAELAATQYVDSDKIDAFDSAYVVDFEGCLKSFISTKIPSRWDFTSEEHVKKLIGILRNFLNYLLHHEVCPEFKDQIDAARSLCDKAPKELWNITVMNPLLPGDFNMACSEIFGGMYQGMYSTNNAWMEEPGEVKSSGISPELARRVFKIGVAANASNEMFAKYREQLSVKKCSVVSVEETGFEITEIIRADRDVLTLYGQQQSAGLKTLGKMRAKTWRGTNVPEEDLTEEEEANLKANPPALKSYEFWVEQNILEKCEIGMKFEATVRETSFDLAYFDAITGVYCSFYQSIPNELMEDWREIEKEWLPVKHNKWSMANKGAEGLDDGIKGDEGQDITGQHMKPPTAEKDIGEVSETNQESTQLEADTDDLPVNRDLVAAGYDDDDEGTRPEAGTERNEENADLDDTAEKGFGVEVHKAGVELKKVPGNADTVVQENYDVERVEEIE